MVYLILFLSALFVGIGYIITPSNASTLLNGYNTMSEEERKYFDLNAFIAFNRRFHLFFGLSFLAIELTLIYFGYGDAAGLILGIYPILAYTYFIVQNKKFYLRDGSEMAENITKRSNKTLKIAAWIMGFTLALVLGLSWQGYKEDSLLIENDLYFKGIRIEGMYSEKIRFEDLAMVKLVDTLPRTTLKENGYALDNIKKGYFRAKGEGRVKLIIHDKTPPFLYLEKKNGKRIYYKAREKNSQALYQEILSAWDAQQ